MISFADVYFMLKERSDSYTSEQVRLGWSLAIRHRKILE